MWVIKLQNDKFMLGIIAVGSLIILSFLGAVFVGFYTMGDGKIGRRILAWFLLIPHFLFVLSIAKSFSCALKGLESSNSCQTYEYLTGIFLIFLSPFWVGGTLGAIILFFSGRRRAVKGGDQVPWVD